MNLAESEVASYPCVVAAKQHKKDGRGGARLGAGRKPVLEDPVSITLDLERPHADAMRDLAAEDEVSVASLVRTAVAAYLKRRRRI
jgi:hypothetical protein